jgi:hypothetical protein
MSDPAAAGLRGQQRGSVGSDGVSNSEKLNGANGMSDIEGKVTRVGARERGQQTSFKLESKPPWETGSRLNWLGSQRLARVDDRTATPNDRGSLLFLHKRQERFVTFIFHSFDWNEM